MIDKTRLITPFLMLTAGTIASIIMYVRNFDLNTMLWTLLIVLIIFYVLGDIARYLYASVKPRIIPSGQLSRLVEEARRNGDLTENAEGENDGSVEELDATDTISDEEGYSEEELGENAEADASGSEASASE
ncbi:MAG: hypothetical protein LUE96_07935 [Lachnospiraceae bacterium]|nr:hypothetical protein [Lachnospiraceae bacterium]